MVEALRPGRHHPVLGDAVDRHRLAPLRVVPHGHEIGNDAEELLAREVVPARDADAGWMPVAAALRA